MKFKSIPLIILFFYSGLLGQSGEFNSYYFDFDHFYRNSFTPVETALGGMTSVLKPSAYGHTIHPTVLTNSTNQAEFTYRYNARFISEKERYRTINLNYNTTNYGGFGLSYVEYQPAFFAYIGTDSDIDLSEAILTRDYVTISYAIEFMENFTAGLSLNHVTNKINYSTKLNYQSFDLGVMYNRYFTFIPGVDSRFVFNLTIDNIYRMGEYDYNPRDVYAGTRMLPQFATITLTKQFDFNKKLLGKEVAEMNIQMEYKDALDDKNHSLFIIGCELNLFEYLTLRYSNSTGKENARRSILYYFGSRNTVGFGLELPLADFLDTELPISIKLDYGHSYHKALEYMYPVINEISSDLNAFSIGFRLN